MKQFISRVQNLSRKAAEVKAAMQQVPPKVAEIREAVAATTGQLQQLKSEIQYSVADLKADHEDHLSEALQEINNSADVFAKAGFALNGVDLEISPVQRMLVHLAKVEDVHASLLRALLSANQHRRTTRAILSSLLQAKQMAETVEFSDLVYNEVVVGIGPIPSVRLCWRPEETGSVPTIQPATTITVPSPAATPAATPQSVFGQGSFFEKKPQQPQPAPTADVTSSRTAQPVSVPSPSEIAIAPEETPEAALQNQDPLARFKKMPDLVKQRK